MKNIYLIILSLISFYSHLNLKNTEVEQRWEVIGSKNDGTVLLKLKGEIYINFPFLIINFQTIKKFKAYI